MRSESGPDRQRPDKQKDSDRRAVERGLHDARMKPLPRVDRDTFTTVVQLHHTARSCERGHTSDTLKHAWSQILQREVPADWTFCRGESHWLFGGLPFVRAGVNPTAPDGFYNGAHVELMQNAQSFELRDGSFKDGDLHNGCIFTFDFEEHPWELEDCTEVPPETPGAHKALNGLIEGVVRVAGDDRVNISWPKVMMDDTPDPYFPTHSDPIEWNFQSWAPYNEVSTPEDAMYRWAQASEQVNGHRPRFNCAHRRGFSAHFRSQ